MTAVLGLSISNAAVIGYRTSVYINLLLLFREIIVTLKDLTGNDFTTAEMLMMS